MKLAFLFPGQGAQTPGMGRDFFDAFSIARHTFEEADDLLSFALSKLMFFGSESELTQTRYSQLALFVHSIALLRTLRQQCPDCIPSVCSGLSLGEYTALHASGKLSFSDTLHLVRARAELMNQACESTNGGMAAVLGLSFLEVEEILHPISSSDRVWIANYNCPKQTVISGTKLGIEKAGQLLKQAGAKRVLPLQVHGAFHTPLMQSAQDELAPLIREASFLESSISLVMNVSGDYVDDLQKIKDYLTRQVTHSVRWEQGIQSMARKEISFYFEIGSGKTLKGLNTKILPEVLTLSLEKVSDLDQIVQHFERCSCN